jgi:RNA polymerase sporulation-specific sigma factor
MKDTSITMYDETFDINLSTGKNIDKVFKKINPLIVKYSNKYNISGYSREDMEQEIKLIILAGIKNFDPKKGVKLSSFLHTHIFNKLSTKIKSSRRKSRNASDIRSDNFSEELYFSDLGDDKIEQNILEDSDEKKETEFRLFLEELKEDVEYDLWLVIRMVSLEGYSIRESCKRLDLSLSKIQKKMKKLKVNEKLCDFYER